MEHVKAYLGISVTVMCPNCDHDVATGNPLSERDLNGKVDCINCGEPVFVNPPKVDDVKGLIQQTNELVKRFSLWGVY